MPFVNCALERKNAILLDSVCCEIYRHVMSLTIRIFLNHTQADALVWDWLCWSYGNDRVAYGSNYSIRGATELRIRSRPDVTNSNNSVHLVRTVSRPLDTYYEPMHSQPSKLKASVCEVSFRFPWIISSVCDVSYWSYAKCMWLFINWFACVVSVMLIVRKCLR